MTSNINRHLVFAVLLLLPLIAAQNFTYSYGGIIRGNQSKKTMSLVFTGGSFGEAADTILSALAARGKLKASFFVTGDFLRTASFQPILSRIVSDGHYLGPHSDSHPLYCDWDDRNKTLVTRQFFETDLKKNLLDLSKYGPSLHEMRWFIPPYEWYNFDVSNWTHAMAPFNMTLFCFTPGTYSNADYAPETDPNFKSSAFILNSILNYESSRVNGLNGFLLLLHLGSGPERHDKFHPLFPGLLDELIKRGYSFVRVDQLLPMPAATV